jgi:hypothetical protein
MIQRILREIDNKLIIHRLISVLLFSDDGSDDGEEEQPTSLADFYAGKIADDDDDDDEFAGLPEDEEEFGIDLTLPSFVS